jgi:hypothetical protein
MGSEIWRGSRVRVASERVATKILYNHHLPLYHFRFSHRSTHALALPLTVPRNHASCCVSRWEGLEYRVSLRSQEGHPLESAGTGDALRMEGVGRPHTAAEKLQQEDPRGCPRPGWKSTAASPEFGVDVKSPGE